MDDDDINSLQCDKKSKFNIRKSGNIIYFYEHVNQETILELKYIISELNEILLYDQNKYHSTPFIELHLYSYGGDCFMGLEGYSFIKNNKIPINTIIDGFIASSATFLFLGGQEKLIKETSMMLIHQLSTSFQGRYEDLKDEFANSSNIMTVIKNIYLENTKIRRKELDKILNRESMITATDILKYGLADKMI